METRRYFGCLVRQRLDPETTHFFVFYARIKDIKHWAGIRRIDKYPEGTQRILRETRTRAITRFLESEPINTIPNNILLAFNPKESQFNSLADKLINIPLDVHNGCNDQLEWGYLEFTFDPEQEEHLRPALIVDGQHRLYGMSDYKEEDLPVIVVSLVDAPLQEQAFQFIVVNNKAVRVPTDNVKAIIADIDEEELQIRLLKAGVRYGDVSPILRDIDDMTSSPFKNLLDWPYNRDGKKVVKLTAIEQSLRYMRTIFTFLEEDEDSLVEIFLTIWRAVKNSYPNLWGKENIFMTKVNLNALNEYIVDRLKMVWEFGIIDIFDPDDVEKNVSKMINTIPEYYWEAEWSILVQDNANVRELIKKDLVKITENYRLRRNWNENLNIINT
jgi:DGQHR domain-containing protein